jgi:hypothetical protein
MEGNELAGRGPELLLSKGKMFENVSQRSGSITLIEFRFFEGLLTLPLLHFYSYLACCCVV